MPDLPATKVTCTANKQSIVQTANNGTNKKATKVTCTSNRVLYKQLIMVQIKNQEATLAKFSDVTG
jgi:hypothetical protein